MRQNVGLCINLYVHVSNIISFFCYARVHNEKKCFLLGGKITSKISYDCFHERCVIQQVLFLHWGEEEHKGSPVACNIQVHKIKRCQQKFTTQNFTSVNKRMMRKETIMATS
jgi:hypothetical protein